MTTGNEPSAGAPRPATASGRGAVLCFLAAAAGSTLLAVLAAAVAGNGSDLVLSSAAYSLRVLLLLAAPCVGAIAAGALLARVLRRPPGWAVALGAPVGLVLALRLDRMQLLGGAAILATALLLLALTLVSRLLIAALSPAPRGTGGGDAGEGLPGDGS